MYRLILWITVVAFPLHLVTEELEFSLFPLVTKSNLRDFTEILNKDKWGERFLEKTIRENQAQISLYPILDKRYFCIAKIHALDYWKCKVFRKSMGGEFFRAFLARVQIHVVIHDVENQITLLRDTISGYSPLASEKLATDEKIHLSLLKQAFKESVKFLGETIAKKFPIQDKVRTFENRLITTRLGKNYRIVMGDILEGYDFKGKPVCSFKVITVKHSSCEAILTEITPGTIVRVGMPLNLLKHIAPRPTTSELEKQKGKDLGAEITEKNIQVLKNLNPLRHLISNEDKFLELNFENNRLRERASIRLRFNWAHYAPKNWYTYLFHMAASGKIIMYFPNYRKTYFQIKTRDDSIKFPGKKQWGIKRLRARLPKGKDSCTDYFLMLVAKKKIAAIEDKLHYGLARGQKIIFFEQKDLVVIRDELEGKNWCGDAVKLSIYK